MDRLPRIFAGAARRVAACCDATGRVVLARLCADPHGQTLTVGAAADGPALRLTVRAAALDDVALVPAGDGTLVVVWTQPTGAGAALHYAVRAPAGRWSPPRPLAAPYGTMVAPAMCTDLKGRPWCAFQSTASGKHHIFVTWFEGGEWAFPQRISDGDGPCFAPALCPFGDGVRVVWDGWIDGAFGVWMRELDSEPDLTTRESQATVAKADTLVAGAALAALDAERSVVVWQRAQPHWGRRNRVARGSRRAMSRGNYLLARRDLQAAIIGPEGIADVDEDLNAVIAGSLPSPVRTAPRIAVGADGAIWLAWRQIHDLDDAAPETGFVSAVSVRGADGWSEPLILPDSGGTSDMPAHLTPDPHGGMLAVYTGRRDGRFHGRVVALPATGPSPPLPAGRYRSMRVPSFGGPAATPRTWLEEPYASPQLLWGDLHRHSDLSGCRWWIEGAPRDAYRYALTTAGLDFLAVTDHTWDLATADTQAEGFTLANAYNVPGVFTTFCAYEASFDEGHFVVLTDQDAPAIPKARSRRGLTRRLDAAHAVVIPHHGGDRRFGYAWAGHDDDVGPIGEIYQPYRGSFEAPGAPAPPTTWAAETGGTTEEGSFRAAWAMGLTVGVVASSDHLATGGAFAGVWAAGNTREAILDALRRRRCFGASDRIELAFWADEGFMGDSLRTEQTEATFRIRCRGTATVRRIDVLADGEPLHTFRPSMKKPRRKVTLRERLTLAGGRHAYTVRIRQADRNMAWSSPIWITAPQP